MTYQPGPAKQAAHQRRDEAITQAVTSGRTVPCLLYADLWSPEDTLDARKAVDWCHQCPIEQLCRDYAHIEPHETHSIVLGGEWWSRGKTRPAIPERERSCVTCGRRFRDRHLTCRTCRQVSTTGSSHDGQAA